MHVSRNVRRTLHCVLPISRCYIDTTSSNQWCCTNSRIYLKLSNTAMSSKFVCTDDRIISRSVLRFLTSILRLTKRTRKDVTQRCVANACSILIQSVVSGIVSTCPAANFKLLGRTSLCFGKGLQYNRAFKS